MSLIVDSLIKTIEILKREREKLLVRVKQAEADKKRAVAAVDRLKDKNIRLKRSLEAAEKSIERHIKKVKLPHEVAEAIEELRKDSSDKYILWASCRPDSEDGSGFWKTLYNFVDGSDNIFKLADALRYGYEIEETHEESKHDQIKRGIREIYEKWSDEPPSKSWESEKDDLARRIYNYVKGELENAKSG